MVHVLIFPHFFMLLNNVIISLVSNKTCAPVSMFKAFIIANVLSFKKNTKYDFIHSDCSLEIGFILH